MLISGGREVPVALLSSLEGSHLSKEQEGEMIWALEWCFASGKSLGYELTVEDVAAALKISELCCRRGQFLGLVPMYSAGGIVRVLQHWDP